MMIGIIIIIVILRRASANLAMIMTTVTMGIDTRLSRAEASVVNNPIHRAIHHHHHHLYSTHMTDVTDIRHFVIIPVVVAGCSVAVEWTAVQPGTCRG
jgi:hypothetical protein